MGYRAHPQPTHKAKARLNRALRRRQLLKARQLRKLAKRHGVTATENPPT